MTGTSATARAHPNIALVKYWGKRDTKLNLPAVGSISITLDTLHTTTQLRFDAGLAEDLVLVNGQADPFAAARITACLELLRERAGVRSRAEVRTENNFPTGAGLASSASGFAALVTAANAALNLGLSQQELSVYARRGSGSAARSIHGGFVEMQLGSAADGSDCFAQPLAAASEFPLAVSVAVISRERKRTGSTDGMELTRESSPYYHDWIAAQQADLDEARAAIRAHDFDKLAAVSEHSCMKMHAVAAAARPWLLYLQGGTVEALHRVRELRAAGVAVFFTIDAGPQLKAISLPEHQSRVVDALADIPSVIEVIQTGLGEGAQLV